eukprot:gene9594-biopygen1667
MWRGECGTGDAARSMRRRGCGAENAQRTTREHAADIPSPPRDDPTAVAIPRPFAAIPWPLFCCAARRRAPAHFGDAGGAAEAQLHHAAPALPPSIELEAAPSTTIELEAAPSATMGSHDLPYQLRHAAPALPPSNTMDPVAFPPRVSTRGGARRTAVAVAVMAVMVVVMAVTVIMMVVVMVVMVIMMVIMVKTMLLPPGPAPRRMPNTS